MNQKKNTSHHSTHPRVVDDTAGFAAKTTVLLEMIKFRHSIFALPFALTSMLVAADGLPSAWTVVWIVVACVAARSMAMAYNRIVDRDIDARNPRTAERALPAGQITLAFSAGFTFVSALLFIFATAMLNDLCLALSSVVIAVLLGYSHCKRFTQAAHYVLGFALAIAPLGAWIAVRGSLDGLPILLAAGVVLWTAGFDVIYSCLDIGFDRRERLFSIPAQAGVAVALRVAAILHAGAVAGFALFLAEWGLGLWAWAALAVCAGLLIAEHRIVGPDDLSRVGPAFFTFNAIVSVLLLLGCAVEVLG